MRALAICCVLSTVWTFALPGHGGGRVARLRAARTDRVRRRSLVDSSGPRGFVCAVSTALAFWVVAGPAAGIVGLPAGLALSIWLGRLESPSAALAREEIDRDFALSVDLLAACAAAGRPPEESLSVVQRAIGGALGVRLGEIAARLSLGADAASEWARCAHDPQLAGLARAMQRSAESGAPLADGLTRVAEDHRRDRRTRNQVRARNVGVKAAGPLAACFLPAFMLVGVVPTVAAASSTSSADDLQRAADDGGADDGGGDVAGPSTAGALARSVNSCRPEGPRTGIGPATLHQSACHASC